MLAYFKSCLILFLSLSFINLSSAKAASKVWEELGDHPEPAFNLPSLMRQKFSNGLRLLYLQQSDSPVIQGSLYLPMGKIQDSTNSPGLAQLTLLSLRQAGSGDKPPQVFEAALESLAAKIGVEVNREYAIISFQCLQEDWPQFLRLLEDMLFKPRWNLQRIELLKKRLMAARAQEDDQPAEIASRAYKKIIYGKSNPWALEAQVSDYSKLSLKQVQGFYKKHFGLKDAVLGLSVPLDFKIVKKNLKTLGEFKNPNYAPKKIKPLKKTWEPGQYWYEKESAQATVLMGHFGERRFNQDKFALLILNDILGGGSLSSRLGARIRSTLGLAYAVYSSFGFSADYGIFYVFAQTKQDSVKEVLREIKKILADISQGKSLTQEELDKHREAFLNSLYSSLEPLSSFISQEARFEFLGYPKNYLKTLRRELKKVSLEDLQKVAKKYIKEEALKILVVGPAPEEEQKNWVPLKSQN